MDKDSLGPLSVLVCFCLGTAHPCALQTDVWGESADLGQEQPCLWATDDGYKVKHYLTS